MNYVLMHKNIPVIGMDIDEDACAISLVTDVYNDEHLPVGVPFRNNVVDRKELNRWWRKRSIPASRDGLGAALEELGIAGSEELLHKCYGLSLSDQYWICPEDAAGLTWSSVNFFENTFSEHVGNILLGHAGSDESMSLFSPDNTSDGWLRKKWTILDGKRCLIKGGSGVFRQEPYNEVIADAVMRRLGIEHVPYRLITIRDETYSVCENFITSETELVTAHHFINSVKKRNDKSVYTHFADCCEDVGLAAKPYLDRMLTVDFLIVNSDRHLNNFGLIRNAETLEYVGFAPVYDNGTSLWHDVRNADINPRSPRAESKPFKSNHSEQIKLVNDFDWLCIDALNGLDEEVYEILRSSKFIDNKRADVICSAITERVELLDEIAAGHSFRVSESWKEREPEPEL